MRIVQIILLATLLMAVRSVPTKAQELKAVISVNHAQVETTNTSVFETLKSSLTSFMNDRQWTNMQFKTDERISCNFAITVNAYDESDNTFECKLTVQSIRPIFNSSYTSTVFSTQDEYFNFKFEEYDELDFNIDFIDKDLTAMMAYYAYLIIGLDMDAMSPLGGTEYLQNAQTIATNSQSLTESADGWKSYSEDKNRYAIINDYLDNGMSPFRQMQYKYYREGLDVMVESPERGRAAITDAIDLLKQARQNKPLSKLPQLFTEYKRDELVGIYNGKGTDKEKETVSATLTSINASLNSYWKKLKQ